MLIFFQQTGEINMKKILTLSIALSSFWANAFDIQRYATGPSKGKVSRLQFDATRSIDYAYGTGDQVRRTYVGFKNVPRCSALSEVPNAEDEKYCADRGVLDEFYLDIKRAPTYLGFVQGKIKDENVQYDFLAELLTLIRYRNQAALQVMPHRQSPDLNIDALLQIKGAILGELEARKNGYPKQWLIRELVNEMSPLYILQREKARDGSRRYVHPIGSHDNIRKVATKAIAGVQRHAPSVAAILSRMLKDGSLMLYSTLTSEQFKYWSEYVQPRMTMSIDPTTKQFKTFYDNAAATQADSNMLMSNFEFLFGKIDGNMTTIDDGRDTATTKVLEHDLFRGKIFFSDFALLHEFRKNFSENGYEINTSLKPSHKTYSSYYKDAVDLVNLYPRAYPFVGASLIHEYGHLLQLYIDPAVKVSHANVLDEDGDKYFVLPQLALQTVYLISQGYLGQMEPFAQEMKERIVSYNTTVQESSAEFYMLDQTVQYLAK